MKRSLRRHIVHAVNTTWNNRHTHPCGRASVLITFPTDAFTDAPTWSPGPDYQPCLQRSTWLRHNADHTLTAVVSHVTPPNGTEDPPAEVWTVTVPADTSSIGTALWDKPHRIARQHHNPNAVIDRQPYLGHPIAAVHDYWDHFNQRWGFVPQTLHRGHDPLGCGRLWTLLTAQPGYTNLPDEVDLLDATVYLVRAFGGRARVYGYDPQTRTTRDPLGWSGNGIYTLDRVLDRMPDTA